MNPPRPPLTARSADRHALYQLAVQEPDADLDFLDRVYKHNFGRKPARIREDFCGTALLASRWVARRPANTALGIDLDPDPITWGEKNIHAKLSPDARSRLTIVEANVLDAAHTNAKPYDAVFALNFSYWIFKQRAVMLDYFTKVRAVMGRESLFILDFFGGSDVLTEMVERTKKPGFTYVWDQHRYDPISGDITCHIGFEFKDGSRIPRAFTYHWRLWTIPELKDLLLQAGFGSLDVYTEGEDRKGEPNGIFVKRAQSPADRCVIAYLVAKP